MTILVDVDGVIFNTQEALLNWLNNRYYTNYTINNITSYDWFYRKFNGNPWKALESESFWYTVKADKQAIDYILKWKHEGHIVKFVTASYYHHALPFKIYKLLNYFNGEFDDRDVIVCHDKDMIRGNLLIDDFTDNVNKFTMMDYDQCAILFSQPWNDAKSIEDNVNIIRLNDWKEIDTIIKYIKNEK